VYFVHRPTVTKVVGVFVCVFVRRFIVVAWVYDPSS
jgi:hypothetical protein